MANSEILHEEGAVTQRAVPGPALYFTASIPSATAKAFVGVLPGYADHAARYAHVMDFWAERGIGSVALDVRGHGRAEGVRGYCERFDEYLDDVAELARLVAERALGAPTFLFGHSFGGLMATSSVLEAQKSWRGLLLTAPFFGLGLELPKVKEIAGRFASRVMPKLALPSGLYGRDMTHDPVRAKAYDADPLVFGEATARWFTETGKAQARVIERANTLTMPLYVCFGTGDKVAKLSAGRAFYDRAGSKERIWDERASLYHEVLNEPEWEDIAGKMADWILELASRRDG